MELSNKKDLKAILAETDMQALDDQGQFESFSVFEGIDKTTGHRIFKDIRENIRIYLNEQQFRDGRIEMTALDILQVGMRNVDLHTTAEVLHFVYECGRVHQEMKMKFDVLNEFEKSQKEESEQLKDVLPELGESSPLQVARAIDKQIYDITEMVKQLPIPQFWPELKEWTKDYNDRLGTIHTLISKLY